MKQSVILALTLATALNFFSIAAVRADISPEVRQLQQRWAEINYQLEGKTQISAFEQLIASAEALAKQKPDDAAVWIWSGIIKSTYAGAKGGIGALKYAKAARVDLEAALKLDPAAMNGSAYTSLGSLYYNVPGWPVGFGDDEKAEELLLKAVTMSPADIDSNYFYGDFLLNEKRYQEAENYLMAAQSAPPRPGRAVADDGRQKEIAAALTKVRKHLKR